MGLENKTDMSVDYNKFHEIPPFKVNIDPSILLNNEDAPWLRPRKTPIEKMIMMVMCNNLCNL
jgi:hypothetical protein